MPPPFPEDRKRDMALALWRGEDSGANITEHVTSPMQGSVSRAAAQGHCIRAGWAHAVGTSTLGTGRSRSCTFVPSIFVLALWTFACQCKIPELLASLCKVKIVENWKAV